MIGIVLGALVLMDAAADGRTDEPNMCRFELPEGRYAIRVLPEFKGDVRWNHRAHEVMVSAIRLRRLEEP